MSEQPRVGGRPRIERPRVGNVGRHDPRADPETDPALPAARILQDAGNAPTVPVPSTWATRPAEAGVPVAVGRTRTSGVWTGFVLSAVVLLLLLIFILQNLDPVSVRFLGLSGSLPTGVALLLAAIAGVLLVAIPGTTRILQLRRAARRGGQQAR